MTGIYILCKYDSVDTSPHFRDGKTEAQGINKIAEDNSVFARAHTPLQHL